MRTGPGWEHLGLHVQLRMSSKVSRQWPDRFSQQRCQYDRCLWCLEVIHGSVLSHPLPDYTGSNAKSQRTTKTEFWLDHPYHNKAKYILIDYNLRNNQVFEERILCAHATPTLYSICCLKHRHVHWMLRSDNRLARENNENTVSNKEIESSQGTWNPQ